MNKTFIIDKNSTINSSDNSRRSSINSAKSRKNMFLRSRKNSTNNKSGIFTSLVKEKLDELKKEDDYFFKNKNNEQILNV